MFHRGEYQFQVTVQRKSVAGYGSVAWGLGKNSHIDPIVLTIPIIEKFLGRKVVNSVAPAQQLAHCRAFLGKPTAIFFDEPTEVSSLPHSRH